MLNPDLWHPVRSFEILMKMAMELVPPVYNRIEAAMALKDLVVVTGPLTIGARIAWEKWRFPMAVICLQPVIFGGIRRMPRYSGLPCIHRMPFFVRKFFSKILQFYADHYCCPPINTFRKKAGLSEPIRDFLTYWLSGPPVLGLFPQWFAQPQPDWVVQPELMGFPLESESDRVAVSEALHEFISEGDAPVVCTFGTGMVYGFERFREVIRMCRETGRRAVLLGPDVDRLEDLPASVMVCRYAELAWLLPRSEVLIHHGGIGTAAEAMRAGIPQLIMPMAFDQPDNAQRIKNLGLGDIMLPRRFTARNLVRTVESITSNHSIMEACKQFSKKPDWAEGLRKVSERLLEIGGS